MVEISKNPILAIRDWTWSEKERWLAALADNLLAEKPEGMPIKTDDNSTIGYLLPASKQKSEYEGGWTADYIQELKRRFETLDDSVPLSVMQDRIVKALLAENSV